MTQIFQMIKKTVICHSVFPECKGLYMTLKLFFLMPVTCTISGTMLFACDHI